MFRATVRCLRSRPAPLPLRRGLAIEAWFADAHEVHRSSRGCAYIDSKFMLPAEGSRDELPLGPMAAVYRKNYLDLELPRPDFKELEAIGFAWTSEEWKYEQEVVPALLKYKELHGNMDVPSSFVVPSNDDEWPEELWDSQLGRRVHKIRSQKMFVGDDPERRQWLEDNGFVFDVIQQKWEKIQRALLCYKELEGDMKMKFNFEVPWGVSYWPEDLWEFPLGLRLNNIRTKGVYLHNHPERRKWLEDLGVQMETRKYDTSKSILRWNKVVVAFLKYKELHGNMNVPRSFVVPSVGDWPEETWEMKLGDTVNKIREQNQLLKGYPERRQWLEDNGFVFDVMQQKWENVQRALLCYKELEGDMKVPRRFVVPSDDDWPEGMRGEHLGRIVCHIKTYDNFVRRNPERRQWLEDNGFDFRKRRGDEKLMARVAARYYGRKRRWTVARRDSGS